MQEHGETGRQAQLREAAEVLVGWIHARRETWANEPLDETLQAGADTSFFGAPSLPSERPGAFTFDIAGTFDAEPDFAGPIVPEPANLPARQQTSPAALKSLASLVRGAAGMASGAPVLRALKVVGVVAVVAVAGWVARPYAGNVKTWLTELKESATSPEPEPVAAKPAPGAVAPRTGQLIVRSDPAGAKVLVDGRQRGVTPLTLDDVSFGQHTVVLESEKGSVRRTVRIAADRSAVVSESIFAGWLTVFAPFDLQVTEGSGVIRLDEGGKVLLPPGPHDLRFENRDLGYRETRRVEILPGETASLSLVASPSTLSVTSSAPAVVVIDGQQVGETPLTNHAIALGTRDIVVKGADGAERRFTQRVTVAPVHIEVDFSKP